MKTRPPATDRGAIDPYAGNQLVTVLGPLRSRAQVTQALTELPKRPTVTGSTPAHIALHELMCVRDLHLPRLVEVQLHETLELMIRQNYRYLNPADPMTWSIIGGEPGHRPVRAAEFAGAVVGHSGTEGVPNFV